MKKDIVKLLACISESKYKDASETLSSLIEQSIVDRVNKTILAMEKKEVEESVKPKITVKKHKDGFCATSGKCSAIADTKENAIKKCAAQVKKAKK
jgi:hypothetical protein